MMLYNCPLEVPQDFSIFVFLVCPRNPWNLLLRHRHDLRVAGARCCRCGCFGQKGSDGGEGGALLKNRLGEIYHPNGRFNHSENAELNLVQSS